MNRLIALHLPGGPEFVDHLRRAWDDGDAVVPVDTRLPAPALRALVDSLAPAVIVDTDGTHQLDGGRPVEPGDGLVMATSGTTGVPKGVVLTQQAIAASAAATSARLGVDPGTDRWLSCLPLAHVGGLSVVLRALHTGTPLEVHDGFDAELVMDAARRGASLVSLVVTALARIDPSKFRRIVLGGSAMPAERPSNTVATYGLTETGSGLVYDGLPLDGVEVAIRDDEIAVRGPMLLRCYRDGHDPKDRHGWFVTGDLGRFGDDGRLQVLGRRRDLIITGGENVWPEPVEAVLGDHPDVREVAVIGRSDPEWGQRVTAVVVPREPNRPPTLDSLRALARETLPAFAAPHGLELADQLPRTALGKLRRQALAEPAGTRSSTT